MHKYTISYVIKKAIYPATQDRLAMLESDPDSKEQILEMILAIGGLQNKRLEFAKMSEAMRHAAMMALTYAEQWEVGLADSLGNKDKYGRRAAKDAAMFLDYRHRYFGKNQLEAYMDHGGDVLHGSRWTVPQQGRQADADA